MKFNRKILAAALGLLIAASVPAFAQVQTEFINAQTGTSYTIVQADQGKLLTLNNASAVPVTLPRAGNNDAFNSGWFVDVENIGAGIVTVTPTTSTINGAASWVLNQNQSLRIVSDGTNYQIAAGTSGNASAFAPNRNFLDNGAMSVVQRGLATSATTAGGTSGCTSLTYVADRWCVLTNVGSQQGRGQVITSTPTPPTGFTNSMSIWRNSAALTQPVCGIQEIPTVDSTYLAGQRVTLSYYAQALAGLAADNGSVINAYVIYGTGSDQGLVTLTASPAITPAWSGITSLGGANQTITTAWVRYSVGVTLPSTATEVGVMLCFTPTATGAGATDGFAFTGVQLEQGIFASPFAFLPLSQEVLRAQRFFVQYADGAATLRYPATCTETTANTTSACTWILPVTMRTTPTPTVLTSASFGITKTADGTAGTCTALAVISTSATPQSFGLSCAATQTAAVGTMGQLIGAASGATNTISISADF